MRSMIVGLAAFLSVGVAHANPYERLDYRSTDHSALAYFRVDFGAADGAPLRQVLGFRFGNDRAMQAGAPATGRVEFTPSGQVETLAISGVDLRQMSLANAAGQESSGFWAFFKEGGWIWIVTGTAVTATIIANGGTDPSRINSGGGP